MNPATPKLEDGDSPPAAFPSEDQMLLVQALKGAPASVLLTLAITGRFMSHKELQMWTRCGKDQVSMALASLRHLGWVVARTSRGPWALGRALPVGEALSFFQANPLKGLGSGGDSDSVHPSESEEVLQASPRRKELIDMLYSRGIREPTASELAELPHVTPEYVEAHLAGARAHHLGVGAAIEAIRLQAPPPAPPKARDRQAEVEEMIRRFKEGR